MTIIQNMSSEGEPQRLNEALLQELTRLRLKVRQQETMINAQAERIKELTAEHARDTGHYEP